VNDLNLPMGGADPIENGRRVAAAYLGRPVDADEDTILVLRDVLRVARDERAVLDKIRVEAKSALGRPTFRVLDNIIKILRGDTP